MFLIFGCKDNLPKPTTKGADTFGCKINGNNWIPAGGTLSNVKPLVVRYAANKLKIEAHTANKKTNTSIYLYVEKVTGIGEYPINFTTNVPPFGTSYTNHGIYDNEDKTYLDPATNVFGKYTFYATNANYPGKIIITRLDIKAKIVSGTFAFTAENHDRPGQIVKITSGRFDTHFD